MTPAINIAKKAKIAFQIHSYTHDPSNQSYGLEASEKLGLEPERVFKTLIVTVDTRELVVAIIPVSSMLSMKQIAKAAGGKKAEMAAGADVERSSGYILGGVSPLGQKKRLRTFIDSSAENFPTIYVSAGRRGLEIELSPEDLKTVCSAEFYDLKA
ncbi:ybaK/ebsC protein [Sulfuricurvum kujiense DSM 16994]|uniref:Cys-tRNA(Pro)/Cys-tRNA(Cys) deacylase n=1 Tax=Sulfuricurvum kujiense (strain ATCC BAA-921 / DSM 16994 / JCM 11577 / YK-1) TaxID=709032 RepID=E4U1C8_SULKY|nr:Cys-tRNA(Pro) deacylase [Sulfuricurvum kujiense]ADR34465.1 ybaK/ebsC protein [Sulfuricurvum kujiense DSM 16994]